MENKESGFSTAFALTVVFSLCLMILSFSMTVVSNEKKINSYKKAAEAKKETDLILFNIEKSLQELKDYDSDADIYQISSIISGACSYDYTVKDVSTGINKNFTSDEILEEDHIRSYILSDEEDVLTEYGWINPKIAGNLVLAGCIKEFENKNIFPLVNNLPPLNINFMSSGFIKTVLEYYKIKNSDEKSYLIGEKLNSDITVKEIAEIFEVSENHPIFDLIGFKTLFWKVSFETDRCSCDAVFAAVPQKENQKKIEKYILLEKNISYKGGSI